MRRALPCLVLAWGVLIQGCVSDVGLDFGPFDLGCMFGPDGFGSSGRGSPGQAGVLAFELESCSCWLGCPVDRPLRRGGRFQMEIGGLVEGTVRSTRPDVLGVETRFMGVDSGECEVTLLDLEARGVGEADVVVEDPGGREVDRLTVEVAEAVHLEVVDTSTDEPVASLELEVDQGAGLHAATADRAERPLSTGSPVDWSVELLDGWWTDPEVRSYVTSSVWVTDTCVLLMVGETPGTTPLSVAVGALSTTIDVTVVPAAAR